MSIDYKRELESASKSMILIHDPNVLIEMIVRMIVQKVKVYHAAILLYDKDKKSYILTVSRGETGIKVPAGYACMDSDNPLIEFFHQRKDKEIFNYGVVLYEEAKKLLRKNIGRESKQLLKGVLYQMEIFDSVICIPSYFHDALLGILLLGKKKSGRDFGADEIDFFVALASDVAMAIRNAQLFIELREELDKKHRLFIHTTVALAAAIDAKDHYTHGHTARVTTLSLEIAEKIMQKNKKKFDNKFLENLHIAGLLHDIGKIGVPEAILNKQGPLTPEERKKIEEHPLLGVTILQPIRQLEESIAGVKYHHEKFDGSGYPEGLKGNKIPLIAAIIAGADIYDAMITDRPYRKRLTKETAIKEIMRVSGTQLAPQIAKSLAELYEEGKLQENILCPINE